MLGPVTKASSNNTECGILSDRIEVTTRHERLHEFSEEHAGFYVKYASFVLKSLKKPPYQRFLYWMLQKEKIETHAIRKVEIKLLPLRRKNGNGLAGKCNTYIGRIQIYPRTLKSCQKLMREFGKVGFATYVRLRARAALIHELLHLKYEKNEEKVRELTKKYSSIFTRNRPMKNSVGLSIYRILFKSDTAESPPLNKQGGICLAKLTDQSEKEVCGQLAEPPRPVPTCLGSS
jgi:hypothetical protein